MAESTDRTAAATAARVRTADNKIAERLRSHGWLVIAPEDRTDARE
jgi:hypothetical protein